MPWYSAEDPRDWAGSELQKKRQQWIQESLREAKVPSVSAALAQQVFRMVKVYLNGLTQKIYLKHWVSRSMVLSFSL